MKKLFSSFIFPVLLLITYSFSDLIGCSGFWIYGYNRGYAIHYQRAMWLQWIIFPFLLALFGYVQSKDPKSFMLAIDTYVLLIIGFEDLLFYLLSPFFSSLLNIQNFAWQEIWKLSHLNFPRPTGVVQFLVGARDNNLPLLFLNVLLFITIYISFRERMIKEIEKLFERHSREFT